MAGPNGSGPRLGAVLHVRGQAGVTRARRLVLEQVLVSAARRGSDTVNLLEARIAASAASQSLFCNVANTSRCCARTVRAGIEVTESIAYPVHLHLLVFGSPQVIAVGRRGGQGRAECTFVKLEDPLVLFVATTAAVASMISASRSSIA